MDYEAVADVDADAAMFFLIYAFIMVYVLLTILVAIATIGYVLSRAPFLSLSRTLALFAPSYD